MNNPDHKAENERLRCLAKLARSFRADAVEARQRLDAATEKATVYKELSIFLVCAFVVVLGLLLYAVATR